MHYIAHRRFKGRGLGGEMNIPAMTLCECRGFMIYANGRPVCFETSENAHQYFAINLDGKGVERGKLTQAIQKQLAKKDKRQEERWAAVWADPTCELYRKKAHVDFWLWDHSFFVADINTLEHIARLVGAIK